MYLKMANKPRINKKLNLKDKINESWIEEIKQEEMRALDNYLKSTSMHGLKYMTSNAPSRIHRNFWLIATLTAMCGAGYFIFNLIIKWQTSPVIMSLSPTTKSVRTIPFPAVVICQSNGGRKSKIMELFGSESERDRAIRDEICLTEKHTELYVPRQDGTNVWDDIKYYYDNNVVQNCSQMIVLCNWRRRDCLDDFRPILTDSGTCCQFNRHSDKYFYHDNEIQPSLITWTKKSVPWTPERGYKKDDHDDAIPYRASGSGPINGLTLVLNGETHEHFCSPDQHSMGFRISVQNPIEMPRVLDKTLLINIGQETALVATPKVITAGDEIKKISVDKRNCYFNDERKLSTYRTYTDTNCLKECLSDYMDAACGCIGYSLPSNKNKTYCHVSWLECAELAADQMYDDEINEDTTQADISMVIRLKNGLKKEVHHCHCLPSCVEITYNLRGSESPIASEEILAKKTEVVYLTNKGFNYSYIRKNMAIAHIYFGKSQFTPYERGELYGFTDLIANTGGLLGLFLGFSVLSLVEIFYFIYVTLCCPLSSAILAKQDISTQAEISEKCVSCIRSSARLNKIKSMSIPVDFPYSTHLSMRQLFWDGTD